MPRSATATRESLVRAGEELFATAGVHGALVRDIVAAAGQANDSAVSYHFGSRAGLLEAILDEHIERMETSRRTAMAAIDERSADLRMVVDALVRPTADELKTQDGRHFLRIIVQLTDDTGVRSRKVPPPLRGTTLARQLSLVEQAISHLPGAVRRERLSAAVLLLTSSLAERARRLDARRRSHLSDDLFVSNLVEMIVALLVAPAP